MIDQFGNYRRYNNANADLYQTYQNGVPLRVTVLNTPLEVQENLDANFGLYAQDSWNIGKLTVNYGLRFDYIKQRIVGQHAHAGPLRQRRRRTTTSSCRPGRTSRRACRWSTTCRATARRRCAPATTSS